jgi:hypothetical protein
MLCALVLISMTALAQLEVTVSPPQIIGQKTIVPLALKNHFVEKIQSVRGTVFLLDAHGKMIGQTTRWVIGGSEGKPGLAAGATNAFYFVVTADKPITTTNLFTQVTISRIVLEGGKLADLSRGVKIKNP